MTVIIVIVLLITSCAIGFTLGYLTGRRDEEIDDGY
jgi:ABC-type dipeptide/oligopeptide/nickel transport system permease component